MPYQTLIRNARIVDGTGLPWYRADVAIEGDRIAAIGQLSASNAEVVIDAEDRFLTPGFVDAHVHTDLLLLAEPDQPASVFQGVTSHIIGQDGISYAPANAANQSELRHYFAGINGDPQLPATWESVAEYLACFDHATALNVGYLLPQGTIRREVMGLDPRSPRPEEIRQMQALAAQGMRDGAVGISTGMDYLPCFYSSTEELIEICKPVAELGGVYVTHVRPFAGGMAHSVREVAQIGVGAGIPVHVSHYNGPAELLSELVDHHRANGVDVTFDTYPYLAGCSILSMVALPRWAEEGGPNATLARLADPAVRTRLDAHFANPAYPLETLQIASADSPQDRELEGLRIPEAAALRGEPVGTFICDLLLRTRLRVACVVHHTNRNDADLLALMRHPAHMGGSDGIYTGSRPHPRGYGAFARYLELVHTRRVLPIEEMVRHLAWHPARRFHLHGRGQIAPGWFADLALFDLATVRPTAGYGTPGRLARGMDWVFVNGQPVLAEGQPTGKRPGVAARGPGVGK